MTPFIKNFKKTKTLGPNTEHFEIKKKKINRKVRYLLESPYVHEFTPDSSKETLMKELLTYSRQD